MIAISVSCLSAGLLGHNYGAKTQSAWSTVQGKLQVVTKLLGMWAVEEVWERTRYAACVLDALHVHGCASCCRGACASRDPGALP